MSESVLAQIVFGITILFIMWIVITVFTAEIKERREKNNNIKNKLKKCENDIAKTLENFFDENSGKKYDEVYSYLKSSVKELKMMNTELPRRKRISKYNISSYEQVVEKYKEFCANAEKKMENVLIDSTNYGMINQNTLNSIKSMQKSDVDLKIQQLEKILDVDINIRIYDNLWKVDILEIKKYLWFYALHKPYSVRDFDKAKKIFNRVYKYANVEVFLAELHAIKQIGGTDVLRNRIREVLKDNAWKRYICKKDMYLLEARTKKENISGEEGVLTTIASGLMWMKAYGEESIVLQYMLENRIQMSEKLQDRLHALSNGGGKAPLGFDVTSSEKYIYFDVSTLSWKDEEYVGLFENLAFQDKTLSYSLAIRDEDKDLFITQGITMPEKSKILKKIKDVFLEEYGSCVAVKSINCKTLSGSGEEEIEGILAVSNECKQMGIVIHIAKIGKKFIVKFYTLFMPISSKPSP